MGRRRRRLLLGAGWSPLAFEANLVMWLHLRDPSGYDLDGNNQVAVLNDRGSSGLGNVGWAVNPPVYPTTNRFSLGTVNGKTVARANNNNGRLYTSILAWPAQGMVLAAYRPNVLGEKNLFGGDLDGAGVPGVVMDMRGTPEQWVRVQVDNTDRTILGVGEGKGAYGIGDTVILQARWVNAANETVARFNVNGTITETAAGTYKNPSGSGSNIGLGTALRSTGGSSFNGDFLELFVINRVPTSAEWDQAMTYLAREWL